MYDTELRRQSVTSSVEPFSPRLMTWPTNPLHEGGIRNTFYMVTSLRLVGYLIRPDRTSCGLADASASAGRPFPSFGVIRQHPHRPYALETRRLPSR